MAKMQKKIWKTVKTVSGDSKRKPISKLIINGQAATKPVEIVNGLNEAFIRKVADLKETMPKPKKDLLAELNELESPSNQLIPLEVQEHELNNLIKAMKKTTSSGSDSINAVVLSDIYPSIKRTLLHLINLSICTGIFPAVFKYTKITPILKSGKDPLLTSSYRPVSNTCGIGKLIERCAFSQIMSHIRSRNIINPNHHGGIPMHSTTTCVAQIIDDALTALEKKKKTAIIATDLSSAFDLVSHKLLAGKCRMMGIGFMLNWLVDFLKGRSQYVDIGGVKSAELPSGEDGVVQGGPSSGELFVLFLNSLPVNFDKSESTQPAPQQDAIGQIINDSNSNEFVDDLNSVVSTNNEDELNKKIIMEFDRIHDYLVSHGMKINNDKTQLMYINPSVQQKANPIHLQGSMILHQDQIRILGFTVSSDLKFDSHIRTGSNNMLKSLNSKSSMIRTLKNSIPMKALSLVANNLVNSTINYGSAIWALTTKVNKEAIQKSQIRAAKLGLDIGWFRGKRIHRQEALDKLDWPNVEQIAQMALLNLVKKAISGQSSEALKNMFKISVPRHPRGISAISLNHKGPVNRKTTNFSAHAVLKFNQLPPELRDPKMTCKGFKSALNPT